MVFASKKIACAAVGTTALLAATPADALQFLQSRVAEKKSIAAHGRHFFTKKHGTSLKAKIDPEEWDCKVAGLPATSFAPMCEKLCPNAEAEGRPGHEMCASYICPTLDACVTSSGQIGEFHQLMMCIQKLEEAHPNDSIDEEYEEEIAREVAGEEFHNHDDHDEDRRMWAEHVEGKDEANFWHVCMAKCPDHDGEGFPTFHDCEMEICPSLAQCVVGEDGIAGSFDLLKQCMGSLGERSAEDEIDAHAEAEIAEEVGGEDHFEQEYNMHVAGQTGDVFEAVCSMKCPDADGRGQPGFETCERHICPFLHACVVDDMGVTGDFKRLMHCLGEMDERAPGRDRSLLAKSFAVQHKSAQVFILKLLALILGFCTL